MEHKPLFTELALFLFVDLCDPSKASKLINVWISLQKVKSCYVLNMSITLS